MTSEQGQGHDDSFAQRYGPWAVIAGASEGTGRAFARRIAAQGVSCILIARREQPLSALAEEIRAESGVDCVTAAIDLAAPDAFDRIAEAAGGREVGLYVSNAGADPNGARFLSRDIDVWLNLIQRNIVTMVQCCHHFGSAMQTRGKGGLLLVNSYACYGGGSFIATYAASKAFELNLAESLWSELRPHGVDVLSLVLGRTDTPSFRSLLARLGQQAPEGLASPDAVAELGLARLPHGPVHNWGLTQEQAGPAPTSAATRRSRILSMDQASAAVFERVDRQ